MAQLHRFGIWGVLRVWGIRSVRATRTNTTLLEGTIRLQVECKASGLSALGFRT